jgi:hypothetical protein
MALEVKFSEGRDIREVLECADGNGIWDGKGAEALGLTGKIQPGDIDRLEATAATVVDDNDRDDDDETQLSAVNLMPWEIPEYSAAGKAIAAKLRRDGVI